MLPSSNRGAGMNMGFPDPCATPAGPAVVVMPYPSAAAHAQSQNWSKTVKSSMVNALNIGSIIPMTSGDEAGVAHPTIKGMGKFTMGNPIVFIDRLPAINLTCPTTGNNMNNGLGAVLVPGSVNVLYCCSEPDLGALGDAMRASSVAEAELMPGDVGYIAIRVCATDLACAVMAQAERLEAAGARALLIDLRQNPGGDLGAAIRLAARLLPDGAPVARLVEADGDETLIHAEHAECNLPLVLLVDGATASAAEVLATALQAHRRALVVGARTYGKGTAWRVVISDGAPARAAALRCFGPDGQDLDRGLSPDVDLGGADAATALCQAWGAAALLAGGGCP